MNEKDPTPSKILKAARVLFVKQGFAATSMSKIATLAKVNHSLIFHHFGNKQKLWAAVKQNILTEANENESILPSLKLPFNKFIRQLFDNYFTFLFDNPDVIQMINWQRIEAEDQPNMIFAPSKETDAWIEAFKHYQTKGEIDPTLNPEFLMTMVCALARSAVLDPNYFIQDNKKQNDYLDFCAIQIIKSFSPSQFSDNANNQQQNDRSDDSRNK